MKIMLVYFTILVFLHITQATERPIIGILTEECQPVIDCPGYTSYIAASYVKAVEQSGARVVPVFINQTKEYYRKVLNSVNGVLFPGGGVSFTDKGGYAEAGRTIINYSKKVNSNGDHFPVLAVCLGFELLFFLEVGSYDILGNCNSSNVALPLIFKKTFHNSQLYSRVPRDVIQILSSLPVTSNHHSKCVTEHLLKKYNLEKKWHVLSTSIDLNGKSFISSVESYNFPIAGIQFHPEKNAFEWKPKEQNPHFQKAIYSARVFYDWLVDGARKNNHSFDNSDAETAALIYNYNATYTGSNNGYFEQIYMFH